ncbi:MULTISPECIES: hypothetical protein [Streptomyces]|uniref:hypothetical protein n=1 Tax=Streptomyces TaxID=1883 RepID=UPI00117E1D85|nr:MULTISPECIES: hypothetical protein [Streptomyces]
MARPAAIRGELQLAKRSREVKTHPAQSADSTATNTATAAPRHALRTAIQRLLAGTPTRSAGALTVVQLAAEAGVKRWIVTHKHPDLRQEFEEGQEPATEFPPRSNVSRSKPTTSKPRTAGYASTTTN